jgi:L-lactate dehydrogenase
VITNPLDVMTYFAIKTSGFPSNKVLGVGTLIDSARFRKILSEKYSIHPDDIRAYILGEHGDTQFPAISAAYSGGVKIQDSDEIRKLLEASELSAYDIMKGKGYTNFAIAMATSLVVESIVKNENRTMPISTLIDGFLGVEDVCLSIPVVVGKNGITKKLNIALDKKEQRLFKKSASIIKEEIEKLIK